MPDVQTDTHTGQQREVACFNMKKIEGGGNPHIFYIFLLGSFHIFFNNENVFSRWSMLGATPLNNFLEQKAGCAAPTPFKIHDSFGKNQVEHPPPSPTPSRLPF